MVPLGDRGKHITIQTFVLGSDGSGGGWRDTGLGQNGPVQRGLQQLPPTGRFSGGRIREGPPTQRAGGPRLSSSAVLSRSESKSAEVPEHQSATGRQIPAGQGHPPTDLEASHWSDVPE